MFADPAVITVNGVAKSLTRINQDGYSSEYLLRNATEEFRLRTRNSSYRKKGDSVLTDRHNVEFIHTVFPVAPATRSTVRKTYAVIENEQGDTLADPINVASAMFTFLTASTNANITKLLNFES